MINQLTIDSMIEHNYAVKFKVYEWDVDGKKIQLSERVKVKTTRSNMTQSEVDDFIDLLSVCADYAGFYEVIKK
jgi:hypothetical protein